jgi:thioredoxin-like negative regulator of GroEL
MLGVGYSLAGDMRRADNYFRQALELADDQAIVLLDYVEHLDRFGRREEAEDFLAHIDPKNGSHELRLQRLRSDL